MPRRIRGLGHQSSVFSHQEKNHEFAFASSRLARRLTTDDPARAGGDREGIHRKRKQLDVADDALRAVDAVPRRVREIERAHAVAARDEGSSELTPEGPRRAGDE